MIQKKLILIIHICLLAVMIPAPIQADELIIDTLSQIASYSINTIIETGLIIDLPLKHFKNKRTEKKSQLIYRSKPTFFSPAYYIQKKDPFIGVVLIKIGTKNNLKTLRCYGCYKILSAILSDVQNAATEKKLNGYLKQLLEHKQHICKTQPTSIF